MSECKVDFNLAYGFARVSAEEVYVYELGPYFGSEKPNDTPRKFGPIHEDEQQAFITARTAFWKAIIDQKAADLLKKLREAVD